MNFYKNIIDNSLIIKLKICYIKFIIKQAKTLFNYNVFSFKEDII